MSVILKKDLMSPVGIKLNDNLSVILDLLIRCSEKIPR